MKKQVEEERSRYQEEHLGQAVLKYAQDVFAISMFKNIKYDQIITCLKLGHLFLSSFSHHFPYEAWIKISPTSRVLGKTSKARGGSGACDASQRRGQVRSCQGSWRSWRWVFSAPKRCGKLENPHGSIGKMIGKWWVFNKKRLLVYRRVKTCKDIPEIVVLWCLRWDLRKFGTTIEWEFLILGRWVTVNPSFLWFVRSLGLSVGLFGLIYSTYHCLSFGMIYWYPNLLCLWYLLYLL